MTVASRLFSTLIVAAALTGPVRAEAPAPKQTGPAMWLVEDADTRIYLFGTFHLLPKGVKWETEAVRKAMAETTTTAVETDTESAYARGTIGEMVRERGLNPSWQTLRGVLGAERYAKLAGVAKRYGIPIDKMQPYRPWFVMLMIEVEVMTASGFDRSLGVERTVLSNAFAAHDRILTMETPEAQIKALATLDSQEALDGFDVSISDLADFKTKIAPMLAAWQSGDVAAIDKLGSAELRREAPSVYRALLVNRNANWIDRLNGWLKGKGTYFVAVGAAHLAGPDSVVAMLEKRGIKVTRVQ